MADYRIFSSPMGNGDTQSGSGNGADRRRAAIVGITTGADDSGEESFDELERLLDTAGGKVFARVTQTRQTPDPALYIGTGKVAELRALCKAYDIDLAVFDAELSPAQIKNLEDALEYGEDKIVQVIDRSMLILDIFALHAVSGEGKVQVELAQLKYTVPRLIGKGMQLSRQEGGILAMRGPGETKLETDRRHVRRRMHALSLQLEELEKNRTVRRAQRKRSGIFSVAIAGYTNAGKSTLLNALTGAGILAEDKLFATLDPTTRRYTLPSGAEILLTDTVGFIRNLPHHLIEAFRSTLEEVRYADAILVVADMSDPDCASQLEVTNSLLRELEADDKPVLYLFNKCDTALSDSRLLIPTLPIGNALMISAKTGQGFEQLLPKLEELASEGKSEAILELPHSALGIIDRLYREANVLDVSYHENGACVKAVIDRKLRGKYAEYIKKTPDGGEGPDGSGETDGEDV